MIGRWMLLTALGGTAALFCSSSVAQSLPDNFTLKTTPQGVATIEKGLMELPYKDVAGLLQDLTMQVRTQNDEWQKSHGAPQPPPAEQK